MSTISVSDLNALVRSGQVIELIDVRTPDEYREVHAELAVNVPLDTFDAAAVVKSRKAAGQPLYMICRSGGRSQRACDLLAAAGFAGAVNVEGGTLAWIESGFATAVSTDASSGAMATGSACSFKPKT